MSVLADPFEQLLEIANRSRSAVAELPAQLTLKAHWSGVGFSSGGLSMVAPMGEVTEILAIPPYTRLPRVKNWVRGLANVRGRLLPLIELEGFWGGQLNADRRAHRVLIFDVDDSFFGLIVDVVYGMKHFAVETFIADPTGISERRRPYIEGTYVAHDGQWALLRAGRLIDDPAFLDTAI